MRSAGHWESPSWVKAGLVDPVLEAEQRLLHLVPQVRRRPPVAQRVPQVEQPERLEISTVRPAAHHLQRPAQVIGQLIQSQRERVGGERSRHARPGAGGVRQYLPSPHRGITALRRGTHPRRQHRDGQVPIVKHHRNGRYSGPRDGQCRPGRPGECYRPAWQRPGAHTWSRTSGRRWYSRSLNGATSGPWVRVHRPLSPHGDPVASSSESRSSHGRMPGRADEPVHDRAIVAQRVDGSAGGHQWHTTIWMVLTEDGWPGE
jgi:hypothetical protein